MVELELLPVLALFITHSNIRKKHYLPIKSNEMRYTNDKKEKNTYFTPEKAIITTVDFIKYSVWNALEQHNSQFCFERFELY